MRRLSWYAGLLALLAAVTLPAQAQALKGGPLGRPTADYAYIPAPAGCASGYVPYFDASLTLQCSPTVWAPATKTLSVPYGTVAAANFTATALATPVITPPVSAVLSKFTTLTVVAGAALADGDYFTLSDGTAKVFEFDSDTTVTPGRVGITFVGDETATGIRDLVVIAVNTSGLLGTAVAAAADTLTVMLTTPGSAGGVNSENVTDAGFLVPVWGDPTHVTTYGYKVACYLADGSSTAASAEVQTTTGHATLSNANYNSVTWGAVSGSASCSLWRVTGGAAPPKLLYSGTLLNYHDVGDAGTADTPPTENTTGRLTSSALTAGRVPIVGTNGRVEDDAGLTYDAATGLAVVSRAAPGAITITQQGTPGATAVVYMLVANLAGGLHTEAGVQSITATSNATLDGTNFNRLTWSAVTGAISYDIYRSMAPWTGSSSGKITVTPITGLTLDDTGLAGVGGPYAQPTRAYGGAAHVGTAASDANVPRLRVANDGGIGILLQQHTPIGGENPALVVKHYDPGYTYNVSSMISAAGAFYSVNWIAVSGLFHANIAPDGTFTISDLGITGMPDFMIGASSDLGAGKPAFAARTNAVAGSLLYTGQDSANRYVFVMDSLGSILGSRSKAIVDGTPTAFATFPIADAATYGGKLIYSVVATKGTALQRLDGEVRFNATREGSTYTATVGTTHEALEQVLSAATGTLAGGVTIACTAGVCTLSATFDTSQATPDSFVLNGHFDSPDAGLVMTWIP